MASEKLIELIERLNKATSEGRVRWSVTPAGGKYRVSLGSAQLEVEKETLELLPEEPRAYSYVLYIKDANGTKTLDVEIFDPEDDKYNLVREMYDIARRNALNLDQILDSMIANIGKDG